MSKSESPMHVTEPAEKAKELRPFLRWAGSKQKLLAQLRPIMPARFKRYFEPFAGSAAVMFALRPAVGFASDTNPEIVNAFQAIKDSGSLIESQLLSMKPDKDLYYHIRKNRSKDYIERAIEFIYMNKVCWNGLYRVNLKGEFNVPYGAPKSDFIIRPGQIKNISNHLNKNKIHVQCSDFSQICEWVEDGDFVFFDPPYVTTHNNNGFIAYNEDIFSWSDQVRLSALCEQLIARGASVIVTNAYHAAVIDLFKKMRVTEISRHSTLASDTTRRRIVSEALFTHIRNQ